MKLIKSKFTRRFFLGAALSLAAIGSVEAGTLTHQSDGVAINGYDTVAYFTESKAVKGTSSHSKKWNGAEWHFSNAQNLATFSADPEKYAPKYGGYCAFAVSRNTTAPTDPEAWTIVDDVLYLNLNPGVMKRWRAEQAENIQMGNENWPGIRASLK